MSDKINLRMLDPKPGGAPPVAPSAEATFAPAEDLDISQKLEKEEQVASLDESHAGGWIGGMIGAAVGALVLGSVAAAFSVWINWFAIGIGLCVAFGVRRLGRGTTQQFGVIGATCAFVGCVIAYHLAWLIVLAREAGIPVLEFAQSVESWSSFIIDVLGPRDFAIYVAAMAAGYKFSYNNVSDQY